MIKEECGLSGPVAGESEASHPTAEEVVRAVLEAYRHGDIDGALIHLDDDVVYTMHLDEALATFAGEARGKAELRSRLEQMHVVFEYVLYRPLPLSAAGNTVRNQVEFMCRHRASGEMLNGRCRFVWTVARGRVIAVEEYHDAERVNAFMRLTGGAGGDPA